MQPWHYTIIKQKGDIFTTKDTYTTHISSIFSSTLFSSYVLSSIQQHKAVSDIISGRLSI